MIRALLRCAAVRPASSEAGSGAKARIAC